jgi:hypothetical protein
MHVCLLFFPVFCNEAKLSVIEWQQDLDFFQQAQTSRHIDLFHKADEKQVIMDINETLPRSNN